MIDYSNMDGFEINQRVANHTMDGEWFLPVGHPENNTDDILTNGVVWGDPLPDYCNSWADAGPIMAKSGIGLRNNHGVWEATPPGTDQCGYCGDGNGFTVLEVNPCRGICIVFLRMKDAEVPYQMV